VFNTYKYLVGWFIFSGVQRAEGVKGAAVK